MKRDWDVIRDLLLEVEDLEIHGQLRHRTEDEAVKTEHLRLLVEEGYVDGRVTVYEDGEALVTAYRLTWDGHELIGNIRDEDTWSRVKAKIAKVGGTVATEVFKWAAVEAVKTSMS